MSKKRDSPSIFNSPKLAALSPRIQALSPKIGPTSGNSHLDRFVSTGRGGAGNIGSVPDTVDLSPHLVPADEARKQNSHHQQKVFTTGRGGAGNMQSSNSPLTFAEAEITTQQLGGEDDVTLSQDPSQSDPNGNNIKITRTTSGTAHRDNSPSHYSGSIGRGGFGNVKATQSEHRSILDRMKDSLKKH